MLSDDSTGVLFNDQTRLLVLSNNTDVHYIEKNGTEHYYTITQYPQSIEKKVKLLLYFHRYMSEHLVKAGETLARKDSDDLSRLPYLKHWFRSGRAVIMQLSNGTVQLNFFYDHAKLILCPLMSAVTYIDQNKTSRTFRFNLIEKSGCSDGLLGRLEYARDKVNTMLSKKTTDLALGSEITKRIK